MLKPNNNQLSAAFNVVRQMFNESGYGAFITDAQCRELATAVAEAVLAIPSTPQPSQE